METHPRAHRNYLVLALVAGGMLLAGAFFLHAGASGFAEAATAAPQPPQARPRPHTCQPIVRVLADPNFDNLVEPETFTICQGHPGGRYMLRWQKAPGANFVTFEAKFDPTNTPFEGGQYDFTFGADRSFVMTPPTKDLGLTTPRYVKYTVTICYDAQQTDCETQDPGGVFQP